MGYRNSDFKPLLLLFFFCANIQKEQEESTVAYTDRAAMLIASESAFVA